MRPPAVVFIALFLTTAACSQTYNTSTIAGGGLATNVPGDSVSLDYQCPYFVAADKTGNAFFVDQNVVLRLDAITGILTRVAGNGSTGFSGDNGPATSAQLFLPGAVTVDSAGNLYIADTFNYRIRKVADGVITTIAGNGTSGFDGDNGPALNAQLYSPEGITVDPAGNLYVVDNLRIRKISSGVITTVAGNGSYGSSGDNGSAIGAQFRSPTGVAADADGNLYISDFEDSRIRRVSNGLISTVAGSALLNLPEGIAVDSAGTLYIADTGHALVGKLSGGVVTTVAGGGLSHTDHVSATAFQLDAPSGVAVDSTGNLYVADIQSGRLHKVSKGVLTTVVGTGKPGFSGDGGTAIEAQLAFPKIIAADSAGNLYIVDELNQRVRKVTNGVITSVAGTGTSGFGGDNGPAGSAQLFDPTAVAVDSAGNLYIADGTRVRKISNGTITTVAKVTNAQSIAVDSGGTLFAAQGASVTKFSNGVTTTVAGNGKSGFAGDNGLATDAQLSFNLMIATDSASNLYIADTFNHRVRKVSNGVITTVVGTGFAGFSGDNGPPASAKLAFPSGIAVDSAGNLYVSDLQNQRIRKISNGVITTVAGNGLLGFSGDNGPAASAQFFNPAGLAVDAARRVYVADHNNDRIRLLTPVPSVNPGGTLNAASSAAGSPVAPGSIATVYGNFLATTPAQAAGPTLPTNLGGLSLLIGDGSLQAPLFAVSGAQVNFQIPWELDQQSQSQTLLSATVNGQTSAAQTLKLAPFAPGIFSMNSQGTGQGAILDSSYRLVDASNPAAAGSTIIQIYCTGLGGVTNQPRSGSPALSEPLSRTTIAPTVAVGGTQAPVLFSGLAPQSVGEYQVNVLVPAASSKGAAVPVLITIGGTTSNTVTIAVE